MTIDQQPQIIILLPFAYTGHMTFQWWDFRFETLQIPNGIAIKLISFYSGGNGILIENAIFSATIYFKLWRTFRK